MAHSRSFLANQNARIAIVGAENLLNSDICPWTLPVPQDTTTVETATACTNLVTVTHESTAHGLSSRKAINKLI